MHHNSNKMKLLISFLIPLAMIFSGNLVSQEYDNENIMLKTIDYKINFGIDYMEGKLQGDCELTVFNPSDQDIDKIPLLLYRLLTVHSVTDNQGNQYPFTQQVKSFEDWQQLQVDFIQISLPDRLRKNEKRTFHIQYSGYLLGYSECMRYVKDHIDPEFTILRMDGYAYPQLGYPSWRIKRAMELQDFDYLIKVTVPDTLMAVNGGILVNKSIHDGNVTYMYKNKKPCWRIDLAVAKYNILTDKKNRVFTFPQDSNNAVKTLDVLKNTIALYSKWFGPLQDYQGYAIIEVPKGYGSQADVTTILQTADAFQDENQVIQLYHEIAHQWNVKEIDAMPCRFESEGFAMFMQYLVQEKLDGKNDAVQAGLKRSLDRFRNSCNRHPRYKNVPVIDYGKEQITDLSYTKGMVLFYVLHELIGEEAFNKAIAEVYRKYYKTGVTSSEFVKTVQQNTGLNLTKFFDDWLYTTKSNEYIFNDMSVEDMISLYK